MGNKLFGKISSYGDLIFELSLLLLNFFIFKRFYGVILRNLTFEKLKITSIESLKRFRQN